MSRPAVPPHRTAFMLSQLGALGAAKFAEATEPLGLRPRDAGVLRLLMQNPGISQRALADRLGAVPSRVVVLIDALEKRDLVTRTRTGTDRRNYELHLTPQGQATMRELHGVASRHEAGMVAPLSEPERQKLHVILAKLAAAHGLDSEVHPG
ncbi:MAG: MarR family transcriptional regulator, partial [Marmoricola sp.]